MEINPQTNSTTPITKVLMPIELQAYINKVNNTALEFVRIPMDKHPDYPLHDRFLVVKDIYSSLTTSEIQIEYFIEFNKDGKKHTDPNQSTYPNWKITGEMTTTLRDKQFQKVLVPVEYTYKGLPVEQQEDDEQPTVPNEDIVVIKYGNEEDLTPEQKKLHEIELPSIKLLIELVQTKQLGYFEVLQAFSVEFLQEIKPLINQ